MAALAPAPTTPSTTNPKGITVSYQIKLAAALPKGEANGFDLELAEQCVTEFRHGRSVRPMAALILFDVLDVNLKADGTEVVRLRIRRAQPVRSIDGRRTCYKLLDSEFTAQTGVQILPHELDGLNRQAFGDLLRTPAEIDEEQERQREQMSVTDELRQHLRVVHGVENANSMTDLEATTQHNSDHEADAMPEGMKHDPGWHGWTRADLEAAEIEADEYALDDDVPEPVEASDLLAEADTLADEHDAAADDDPEARGVDLDNEDDDVFEPSGAPGAPVDDDTAEDSDGTLLEFSEPRT